MKDKVFKKKDLGGKCPDPKCGGEIMKGITSRSDFRSSSSSKFPKVHIEYWHCKKCKKCFEVLKEQ